MLPELIALIPAAGQSRRMGVPKLLLRLGTRTVIEHLVLALRHPAITHVVVLVRSNDVELQTALAKFPEVRMVIPAIEPEEMRASVQCLLEAIAPQHAGGWLLVPADSPWIEQQVLDRLIATWQQHPDKISVPTHMAKRGHPTLFPASLPHETAQLPSACGLNSLLRSQPERVLEVACDEESVLYDLDTPEDFARLLTAWRHVYPQDI